jgi:phosphoadenosine phosphosulfate reductase
MLHSFSDTVEPPKDRNLVVLVNLLNRHYAEKSAEEVLYDVMNIYFKGKVTLVSSFGAEAAVLLHMAAGLDRTMPILLVDTLMLFPETLDYQRELTDLFGLTDVRRISPDPEVLARRDRFDALHLSDPDACCDLRKVQPLAQALLPFDAVISGRKRYQASTRRNLAQFELDEVGQIRVNPLANWDGPMLRAYAVKHALPPHPLVAKGFPSIGCKPCTSAVSAGEDSRAGRWRGLEKVECGIHFGAAGAVRHQVLGAK